jgi:hypothetical protein
MTALPHLDDQTTTVAAWGSAVRALSTNGRHAYNLMYSVTEPGTLTASDKTAIRLFNTFALEHQLHTTDTVANTIFPLDTFLNRGATDFYDFYIDRVFPKVRKQWGTYFERLVRRRNDDGTIMMAEGKALNPLALLVDKLKRRAAGLGRTTTHYELTLDDPILDLATYDPQHDGAYQVGGPCLSHLSFKVDAEDQLRLTAFYRSHWYIARALGNLIGLARLQSFVAQQAALVTGPLTIIASEAVLDLSGKGRTAADVREMLKACGAISGKD